MNLFWGFVMILCTILNLIRENYLLALLTGMVAVLDFIVFYNVDRYR